MVWLSDCGLCVPTFRENLSSPYQEDQCQADEMN